MARQNIEDKFWLEAMAVASMAGVDIDKVAGNASRFIRYAQEKHRQGKLVSDEEFEALGFLECLFPLFARRVDGGIECAGAAKHFGWLDVKSEAGSVGGRVSAQRPRDEKGRLLPKQSPSNIQAESKQNVQQPKHVQASNSISNSNSNNTNTGDSNSAANFEARFKFDLQSLFDAYPKHEKKTAALAILAKHIRTQTDFDDWKRAIENYAARCRRERTDYKFVMTFPKFAEEWTDWRDWKSGIAGKIGFNRPSEPAIDFNTPDPRPDDPEVRAAKADEIRNLLARAGNLGNVREVGT